MPIGKGRLVYDSTTPAKGDSVAAYLRTGSHALTSTDLGGGVLALDVNVGNDITAECDLDGDYDVSTNPTPDSVGLIVHDRGASPDETDQNQRPTADNPDSDNVDPANVHALDTNSYLMGWDGSAWDRLTRSANGLEVDVTGFTATVDVQGNVADDAADAGDPVKIGFRATDAALTALSAADDRADGISDLYRRQWINSSPNISLDHAVVTVGTTAVQLDSGGALGGRRYIRIQNQSAKDIWVGKSTVTTSGATAGLLIPRGGSDTIEFGENIPVYAIGEQAGQSVMFMELA